MTSLMEGHYAHRVKWRLACGGLEQPGEVELVQSDNRRNFRQVEVISKICAQSSLPNGNGRYANCTIHPELLHPRSPTEMIRSVHMVMWISVGGPGSSASVEQMRSRHRGMTLRRRN
jgi:hypothetical protein